MASKVARREFLNSAAAAGALVAGARVGVSWRAQRPNVLFILADDLGYGDLSCYGRSDYQTPVVEALARQGVKFMSTYAAVPGCTPTWCALATGRCPQRTEVGLHEPLTARDRDEGLPPDQLTIASLLKAARYETIFAILSGAGDDFTHPLEWPGTGVPGILE
jgi:hypothetical protein